MDQDVTWYGGRPRPTRHCVRWGPSSTQKGHSPQFSAHVFCGKTAGWIKMPLGTAVGLVLEDTVLDGDPAPLWKGHSTPFHFLAFLSNCWALVRQYECVTNGQIDGHITLCMSMLCWCVIKAWFSAGFVCTYAQSTKKYHKNNEYRKTKCSVSILGCKIIHFRSTSPTILSRNNTISANQLLSH